MQSGRRKLAYVIGVAIRNLYVEYGHCAVKHTYENVLKGVVKVTNGL